MNRYAIIDRALTLYYSKEKQEIAGYSKYDALYDVTCDMDIPDDEFYKLLDEMKWCKEWLNDG